MSKREIHAMVIGAVLAACQLPATDYSRLDGGGAPEPTGTMRGTVLYVGPRPSCLYDAHGHVVRVLGNAVLLLFLADNPPPPTGTATSASNLLLVPGGDLFNLGDCLPQVPTAADLGQIVTRSAPFTWPAITLANDPPSAPDAGPPIDGGVAPVGPHVDYQVRAFYDSDEDFNPFFSVRRLATRGDIAGGAFENTAVAVPQFLRIRFGSLETRPNGEVIEGVAVTLGAPVNTELPAFMRGDSTQALSSEAVIPPVPDPVVREQQLFDLTHMELTLIDPNEATWRRTLRSAGMAIDSHPSGFAFFVFGVDANRDGMTDPHPILGSAGVAWQHPIVILRRARNPVELAARVPDVALIATVRPTQTISQRTFSPTIQIAVPPIAAVTLDPRLPQCRIPYIAPGNLGETYEMNPVDCQEVPTGNYDINVLAGIAGGRSTNLREQLRAAHPDLSDIALDLLVGLQTDNDWVIDGGQYSSQAWAIPNELGCPDRAYNPRAVDQLDPTPLPADPTLDPCDAFADTRLQRSQGPAGRFSVFDPDQSNAPDATDTTDGHGVATCQTAFHATTGAPGPVAYMPVPPECCGAIRHLCGLPLCATHPSTILAGPGGENAIREVGPGDYDADSAGNPAIDPATGAARLHCVPFLMPVSCCQP